MKIYKTSIIGALILEPHVYSDNRGYLFESFLKNEFVEKVGKINFIQENESMSTYGVIRGLHFQFPPFDQSKLVRCVKGRVLDVAVDLRKGSPTYGCYVSCELSEENHLQFFLPKGFAHGFAVLSDTAVFQYKCDNYYSPESEGGISVFDENLNIDWMIPADKVILSERDSHRVSLKDFESPFEFHPELYKDL